MKRAALDRAGVRTSFRLEQFQEKCAVKFGDFAVTLRQELRQNKKTDSD
ncbi:hypothetical protein ACVDG8_009390 [Mesorhizobium sp. ORM8.1]